MFVPLASPPPKNTLTKLTMEELVKLSCLEITYINTPSSQVHSENCNSSLVLAQPTILGSSRFGVNGMTYVAQKRIKNPPKQACHIRELTH